MTDIDLNIVPIQPLPAYRTIAKTIEKKIVDGEWALGTRLPPETSLAVQFGVHRSTLREAIRTLEESGLIKRTSGKTFVVSAPLGEDITSRLATAFILQDITFLELWEAVLCIEPALAEGAAAAETNIAISSLQDNIERTREALRSGVDLAPLDIEFHNLIAQSSSNRALLLCRAPISKIFHPAFKKAMSVKGGGERLLYAHEQILLAIQSRSANDAREWMRKHIIDFRRGYELSGGDIHQPVDRAV
jgi:GntR family transcriptional repressor for pyruvate dehydrogenase complex